MTQPNQTNPQIIVSIRCLVYNHEPYLRQCLDGFVMQKTNFKFEAIVHDDASTDGSAAIIREYAEKYPDIIKPIFETENQYSKHDGSLTRIMNAEMRGKYIAYCEGDDYWTDPLKLQKQVDILEKNSDVTMVYTGFKTVDENSNAIYRKTYERFKADSFSGKALTALLHHNFIMTLTVCIRREILFSQTYVNAPTKFDYTLFCTAAFLGKFYFINEETGAYRKTPAGAMATQRSSIQKRKKMVHYYFSTLVLSQKTSEETFSDKIKRCFVISQNYITRPSLLFKLARKDILILACTPPAAFARLLDYIKTNITR